MNDWWIAIYSGLAVYQEKCWMGFSYPGYVLPGHMKIIIIGKFIFPKQYDMEKCNLYKCTILSQTKTTEKQLI